MHTDMHTPVVAGLVCVMSRYGRGEVDEAFGERKVTISCNVSARFPSLQPECLGLWSFSSLADIFPWVG